MKRQSQMSRSRLMNSDWKEDLVNVFFDSQLAGYAGKPRKTTVKALPCSKLIVWERAMWRVTDVYFTTPVSTSSGGMTTIYYDGVPVWLMQYMGRFDEAAIPTLKKALRKSYAERHEFNGGRGIDCFVDGNFTYLNQEARGNNFNKFSGIEYIRDIDGEDCGYHRYQGGTLF